MFLRKLWILYLPLLYLPDIALGRSTSMGFLSTADFLIGPYIILLGIALNFSPRQSRNPQASELRGPLLAFLVWALISTFMLEARFEYETSWQFTFGILKLAKLWLYVWAGLLTARVLARRGAYRYFYHTIAIAGMTLAIGILATSSYGEAEKTLSNFTSNNATGVVLAMLTAFILAEMTNRKLTHKQLILGFFAAAVMLLGLMLSESRGGWISLLVAAGLLSWELGSRHRRLVLWICIVSAFVLGYSQLPSFKELLDRTLWPDPMFLRAYGGGFAGFDDGGRLSLWISEGSKFFDAPLFGAGFFNRHANSGLLFTGSHNFWLQIFLETGLLGGTLVLLTFVRMWRHSGTAIARETRRGISVRTVLVAALVGGMSGEYFYGGLAVFTLFVLYGSVGSLPRKATRTNRSLLRSFFANTFAPTHRPPAYPPLSVRGATESHPG